MAVWTATYNVRIPAVGMGGGGVEMDPVKQVYIDLLMDYHENRTKIRPIAFYVPVKPLMLKGLIGVQVI